MRSLALIAFCAIAGLAHQLALTKGKLILKGATKDALKAMPEFHYVAT